MSTTPPLDPDELRERARDAMGELVPHLRPSDWGTTVRLILRLAVTAFPALADLIERDTAPATSTGERRSPSALVHLGRRLAEMKRDVVEQAVKALRPGWFADLEILLTAASDASWELARITATIETELGHAREMSRWDAISVLEKVQAARG